MAQREVQHNGRADLHMHTIHSDGALTPSELVTKTRSAGIHTISITDHDSVSGVDEAIRAGTEHDVVVIPGVEMSASLNGKEIHLLGYFINHHDDQLLGFLSVLRDERIERAEKITEKLNRMNIPLTLDSVLECAGQGAVGRPHVAAALLRARLARSYQEVFDKYIADGGPAYVAKRNISPEQIIKLIADAGGLTFLAHPGRSFDETLVNKLIDAGLDGIEVIHPSHSPSVTQHYRKIIHEYYLLESGGSDFHGGIKGDDGILGAVTIGIEAVEKMRQRLFSINGYS